MRLHEFPSIGSGHVALGKAAEACALAGNMDKRVEMALDIERSPMRRPGS
jgi:hypothetical protein